MKILLDENLPHQLRLEIEGHEVITTAYMEWSGVENGELLRRAADARFEVLLTNDRGIEYEQNLDRLPLAVVLLLAPANNIEAIRLLYPQLKTTLAKLLPREFVKLTLPA